MKIAIGCDHNAYRLKESIKQFLAQMNIDVVDFGSHTEEAVDYPDVAFQVANEIRSGNFERGILFCGTGIGVAIAAGKVPGIRAALCHDIYSAERARKSNNAQILTMGAQIIGLEHAKKIVDAWIHSEFQGGDSERKVQKIMEQELYYLRNGDNEETDEPTNHGCR
ncbi:ribose 5-phosphate isomerase B [Brevibacillus choshinensis]|uniref:ribose 5-phosphate isomerase B n=1 Tax=Brevibacillus choshinensis TaxID=54911 RepID=UPI002E201A14|nr:ribose 5-phosphate isomerase B [Brevibacillus choshinensis]MED4781189.1 ribose 5-phosphate isomerase B [Brevibacillus choshinensis]